MNTNLSMDSIDLKRLEEMMEEMAGKPRERHIRQSGERNKYEQYNRSRLNNNNL